MNKELSRPTTAYLYKYGPNNIERLEPVICSNELYFPTPTQLNDPAEAKPKLINAPLDKIISFLYEAFVSNNPGLPLEAYQRAKHEIEFNGNRFGAQVLLQEMARLLHSEFETFRIYSLSKRYDNMALWANYATNHAGYCLEFVNSDLFAAAREVTYVDTVTICVTDPEQRSAYFLFHKTRDWSTEEEVRLVAPRGSKATITFDPKLLTRVIIGRNMPSSNVGMIMKWADVRSPKLIVVRAEYDEFNHKLCLRRIIE